MDKNLMKAIAENADDLPLTRLCEIAQEIRPYRVYASYGILYKMCLDGDLQSFRDKRGRVWVVGRADEIAESVMRRFQFCNGRWSPRPHRALTHSGE